VSILSAPQQSRAAGGEIAITAIRQLEIGQETQPVTDSDLVKRASQPGTVLSSIDAATYQPFAVQWLVLDLSRTDPARKQQYFRVNHSQRREIDAYLIVEGNVVARTSGGYSRVSIFDSLDSHTFQLPLEAWTGTRATILLRQIATERQPLLPQFLDPQSASASTIVAKSFLIFMVGCCIVFVLFQLLIYFGLRDRVARDYAIFVVLTTSVHVVRTGHLSWDFWPGASRVFPGDIVFLFRYVVLFCALRMINSFLDLEQWRPRLHQWNNRVQVAVLVTVLIAACFGQKTLQAIISLWHLPTAAWGICLVGMAVAARRPGARYLLVAWLGMATTATYANLVITGILPPSTFVPFAPPLGILWEMAFNGAGLVVRLDAFRQDRIQARIHSIQVEELGRLVKVVCHDISNPLMVIRFALDRMHRQLRPSETAEWLTEAINQARQGERAVKGIIDDVRALELLRSRENALPVSAVNLTPLFHEAWSMFREIATSKGVRIDDHLPAGDVIAYAAPNILVRHVLANILSNAIKFTPAGKALIVSLQRRPGQIGLCITDAGAGIAAETVAALDRAAPLTSELGTAGERGSGFGLRITRDFVVAMGGSLQFEVPEPNAGTRVTIWLRAT
jgi:signal transduction histidine kinase